MIKDAIFQLTQGEDLGYDTAQGVMNEMMEGTATPVEMAAYLTALAMKGETVDEITASAAVMRNHALKLPNRQNTNHLLEIVGTGGDKSHSFNISTTSALVLAAAQVPVAKHGNRASSSLCGSADVLEALGIKIDISPEKSLEILDEINICFLFAQRYHAAMKHVAPVRREMGIRTIFNILGPLSNPLSATMQLLGVYDEKLMEPMAQALINLGVQSGMVVYGTDGLDEISMSAPTKVIEIRGTVVKSYQISPTDFGMDLCRKEDLLGGSPAENAQITRKILEGEKSPRRDAVVLNAGAALYIARQNITLKDATKEIESVLDGGKAMETLEQFIALSNG